MSDRERQNAWKYEVYKKKTIYYKQWEDKEVCHFRKTEKKTVENINESVKQITGRCDDSFFSQTFPSSAFFFSVKGRC